MKRTERWAPRALAAVLPLVVAVGACAGEPADEPPPSDPPPVEMPGMDPPDAGFPGDAPDEPQPITLEAVDDSGVEGRATAIHRGDSVQVNLMVQGLPGEGEYAAHIHRGTCESGGGVVVPLNSVAADRDGMGRSTTAFAADRLSADERYFVQVHGSAGAIACGDVQGHG